MESGIAGQAIAVFAFGITVKCQNLPAAAGYGATPCRFCRYCSTSCGFCAAASRWRLAGCSPRSSWRSPSSAFPGRARPSISHSTPSCRSGRRRCRAIEYLGREDIGTGALGTVGNIIWFVLAGWWLALAHLVIAIALRDHDHRHSVRVGASEARRARALADRDDDRAGGLTSRPPRELPFKTPPETPRRRSEYSVR